MHLLVLADAVNTVHRLLLGGGVPPRIHDEHVIRLGQVQTETASLERDEEHRLLAARERLDDLGTVAGRTVQVQVPDALLRQARRNALEVAGELAEHQHAVALLEQVG